MMANVYIMLLMLFDVFDALMVDAWRCMVVVLDDGD
jgi:hypothetical protein